MDKRSTHLETKTAKRIDVRFHARPMPRKSIIRYALQNVKLWRVIPAMTLEDQSRLGPLEHIRNL